MGTYVDEAIDTAQLANVVRTGVRFLDNVATMSDFPLQDIEDTVSSMRKIGLGVMGWAQMLSQLGITYGSDESLLLGNILMNRIDHWATQASHQLAQERGNFDAWEDSKYADPEGNYEWFANHVHEDPEDYPEGYDMRNHNVTTVAPTGTTSMLADTTGGIEPYFDVAYRKHVGEDIGDLVEMDSYFADVLQANGVDVDAVRAEADEKMSNPAKSFDGPTDLSAVPDDIAERFVTAGDVAPTGHTMMQRVFQQGVDSGISKTINLPSSASRADVAEAYSLALESDELGAPIKGMTVYRDQSREVQVMTTQKHSEKELESAREKLEEAGFDISEPED
jgi:ribonucleoside-diphosphate reductase alpha chain